MVKKVITTLLVTIIAVFIFTAESCSGDEAKTTPTASSGVKKATVAVPVDDHGNTSEQVNIKGKYTTDNQIGAIKHLYVISPYSGQVILYSTVRGKVTSGSKRLDPATVTVGDGNQCHRFYGFNVIVDGKEYETPEVLGADGTYGPSDPYIYWFDQRGVFHQHFLTGGQIVHVSSEPISVKSVILNVESNTGTGQQ